MRPHMTREKKEAGWEILLGCCFRNPSRHTRMRWCVISPRPSKNSQKLWGNLCREVLSEERQLSPYMLILIPLCLKEKVMRNIWGYLFFHNFSNRENITYALLKSLPMSNIGGISRLRNFLEMVMERTRENPIREIFACPQGRALSY